MRCQWQSYWISIAGCCKERRRYRAKSPPTTSVSSSTKYTNACTTTAWSTSVGFYLDVIKDRLYTMQADSRGRRSAQTAMYHIAEAMVRWLAPILSFTAEEIWSALPQGGRGASVFLATYHEIPALEAPAQLDWSLLLEVRDGVTRELEGLRRDGTIGGALDASIEVFCAGATAAALKAIGDELRFVMITSAAKVGELGEQPSSAKELTLTSGETYYLEVAAEAAEKCVRCWHRRSDVGSNTDHPELCGRCVSNVSGNGETREFA